MLTNKNALSMKTFRILFNKFFLDFTPNLKLHFLICSRKIAALEMAKITAGLKMEQVCSDGTRSPRHYASRDDMFGHTPAT
jgi:hypothetical protein